MQKKKIVIAALVVAMMLPIRVICGENDSKYTPEYIYDNDLERMDVEPVLKKTTAYCVSGTTASGAQTRRGICAGRKEDIGKSAIVYYVNEDGSIGDFCGYWEILDTGVGGDSDGDGIGAIEAGYVLDMYFPTLEECKQWMRDTGGRIYVQIIDAKG